MPLTDIKIRKAKAAEKPYKLFDELGLYLLVNPNGSKLWRFRYKFGGKEKLLALGSYPAVSLKAVRDDQEQARATLKAHRDPSKERQDAKREAEFNQANTFGLIAAEYMAKLAAEGRASNTVNKYRWLLTDLAAALEDRPIREIRAHEVLKVLKRVEARGARESAIRLRAVIGAVFRYAIATARAENDPTLALRGALLTPKVRHRAALIDPDAIGGLMRAIDGFEGLKVTRCALKLVALCFPRPGELRHAEWSEIDLDGARWRIPAERTKMRREHVIPLSPQALAVFRELHALTWRRRLAFPGVRNSKVPMSENTLNAALRRMGYGDTDMTAHGFRAMASTRLNESGLWGERAIEAALAHQDPDEVRRAYARGVYWDERVRMMNWWANYLDEVKARPAKKDMVP